ncbi:hypothetical protein ACOI1C_02215 [Bacillus sp. DJP31]|uniref:hypothetical protein n=1 Tax=Bacillus sp. DJP31 TaxID=3409789 RepID=UPI003BB5B75B
MKWYTVGIMSGLISGVVLGLFLKLIQIVTHIKVYTLLLNVDFMPIIGHIVWPELIEFVFHLLIACIIGLSYGALLIKRSNRYTLAILLTLPTIPLYVPLTLLSIKETPALYDLYAILWWVAGHILFALALALSHQILVRRV